MNGRMVVRRGLVYVFNVSCFGVWMRMMIIREKKLLSKINFHLVIGAGENS